MIGAHTRVMTSRFALEVPHRGALEVPFFFGMIAICSDCRMFAVHSACTENLKSCKEEATTHLAYIKSVTVLICRLPAQSIELSVTALHTHCLVRVNTVIICGSLSCVCRNVTE